jgi:hypothetical protein
VVHLLELPYSPPHIARETAYELVAVGEAAESKPKKCYDWCLIKQTQGDSGALHSPQTVAFVQHKLSTVAAPIRPVVAAAAVLLAGSPVPPVAVPLITREHAKPVVLPSRIALPGVADSHFFDEGSQLLHQLFDLKKRTEIWLQNQRRSAG